MSIDQIKDAIESGGTGDDLAGLTIPETYRAAHTLRSEQEMFADMASADKDPRKSLHVGQVPTPELAPDEVVVAVQSGWGWQIRCVEAELRGDATVLTYVRSRPC